MYHNVINDTFTNCQFSLFSPFHIVSAGTRTLQQDNTIIFLLVVVALAASLIVFAILIYSIKELKKKSCGVCDGKQTQS